MKATQLVATAAFAMATVLLGCGESGRGVGTAEMVAPARSQGASAKLLVGESPNAGAPASENRRGGDALCSKVLFHCHTENGKEVRVCDRGKTLEYTFGRVRQQPELSLTVPRAGVDVQPWAGAGAWIADAITIPNGNTNYTVFRTVISPEEQDLVESGIDVERGGERVARIWCKEPAFMQVDDWNSTVEKAWVGMPITGTADAPTIAAIHESVRVQQAVRGAEQFGHQYGLQPSSVQPGWPGVPYDVARHLSPPPARQPASPAPSPEDRTAASPVPSPASQPAPRPGTPLQVDLPADLVRTLQADLNELGMRGAKGAPLAEDGIYGRNTALAVAAFQREEGLSVTGIADNRTLGAVRSHAIVAGLERAAAQDVSMRAPDLRGQDVRAQGLDDIALGAMALDTLASPRDLHSFPSRDTAIMHAQRSVTSQLNGADVLRDTYPSSWPTTAPEPRWPDEPALRRAADMPDHFDPRQRANASPLALHDALHLQPQANALRPFSDPSHPQHALYNDLKARLPEFPEERLAQIAGECHKRRYQAGWEGTIEVNDRAVLISQHWPPGRHLSVDLLQPAPPVQQTMQEMAGVDLQRTQMQDRNRQQEHQSAHSMG